MLQFQRGTIGTLYVNFLTIESKEPVTIANQVITIRHVDSTNTLITDVNEQPLVFATESLYYFKWTIPANADLGEYTVEFQADIDGEYGENNETIQIIDTSTPAPTNPLKVIQSLSNSASSVINIVRGLIKDLPKSDGRDLFEFETDNKFTLSESFISESSIKVFQNGTELDSQDWTYNADNNQVTISFISSGGSLNNDDLILITYNYFKKYSDVELLCYIISALSYFAENRYKKIFEINESNEIVACNDVDPTRRELNFIAIITSILVDPMNIEIRTPDFTLSAQRNKSDREQISEAFTRFGRFVGQLDFEETDHNKKH